MNERDVLPSMGGRGRESIRVEASFFIEYLRASAPPRLRASAPPRVVFHRIWISLAFERGDYLEFRNKRRGGAERSSMARVSA